jgi:hypothetical protein
MKHVEKIFRPGPALIIADNLSEAFLYRGLSAIPEPGEAIISFLA